MAPIVNGIKSEYPDIVFKDINTSDDGDTAEKYGVASLPTLVFEKDGKEVGRLVGLKPKSLICKKIAEVF
jgi:thioredoxin 1